jgi:hypothetical protein
MNNIILIALVCFLSSCTVLYDNICGENGTIDWDDNIDYPPPHCG